MPKAPPPVDPERDHCRGTGSRTLLMYGDYQCPYTRSAYRVVQALEGSTPMRFAWRHLPLTDIHPHALQAAVAAEAAHDQGRFWDMHDAMFTGQEHLSRDDLRRYASALGLDAERFDGEFASDEQLERITTDVRGALVAGLRGTPSIFVDGVAQSGYEPEALEAALTG